jgi:hypothetical protein
MVTILAEYKFTNYDDWQAAQDKLYKELGNSNYLSMKIQLMGNHNKNISTHLPITIKGKPCEAVRAGKKLN